ncbi:MAG: M20/M25/M40 family metallo-hydrolase [Candidatus Helarchaeota archaeon]|nr:M20/M25/M40 family metallo-hydrolase [Candidatus Helarchaeota archaeon]
MDIDETKIYDFEKDFAVETIKILQELVKIDTTNPPGNEVKAAEWIYDLLSKEGIDAEVIESAPGRGNVISRLKGKSSAPSLLLLSHLDVVPSQDLEKWEVPPFSGELKDGYIWGRGSLDDKGTTAPQLMTYIRLYREGFKPQGDIVFAATADEESGGYFGPGWLVKNKFDMIKADNVITEGGGQLLPIKTKTPNYVIQISEKGMFWTKIRTRGDAGHGSMPGPSENMAIVKMMKVVEKIAKYKPPIIVQDLIKETVKAMDLPAAALTKRIFTSKRLIKLGVWIAKKVMKEEIDNILYPLVQNKITPTVLRAGEKENNIPGLCEATLDARLLSGFDRTDLYKELEKILGKKLFKEVELESILDQPGGLTPTGTDFYLKIEETIGNLDPGAKLVPFLSPGSTDMLHFRRKGIKAYGFVPMKMGDLSAKDLSAMPHGYNERLSIDNLMFATRFFYDLALKY